MIQENTEEENDSELEEEELEEEEEAIGMDEVVYG